MKEQPYQWNAADYARHSSSQFQWAQELIGKLRLQGSEDVLDIGCGDGKVSAALAQAVPHGSVTGVDRSREMVTLAQRQFGSRAVRSQPKKPVAQPRLLFLQMDAARLAFRDGFDAAFSNATLHWVRDHQGVLEGVARSLRKGGRLIFQMGGRGNAAEIIAELDEVMARKHWQNFFTNFAFPYTFLGPEDYHPLLADAGLRERRVELVPKDMRHAGKDGLAGWIRTTWLPYLERVRVEERQEFISEIIDSYQRKNPADQQGVIHVKMVRLEVEAEK